MYRDEGTIDNYAQHELQQSLRSFRNNANSRTPEPVFYAINCLIDAIVTDPNHQLYGLLPQKNNASYNFRNNRPFVLPRIHTNRPNNTFDLQYLGNSKHLIL